MPPPCVACSGDGQNFTGLDHEFPTINPELQRVFEDVSELLVDVTMFGHDAAFLQQDTREHDATPNYELALQ